MTGRFKKESFLQLLAMEECGAKRLANQIHHDLSESCAMIKFDIERAIQQVESKDSKSGIELLGLTLDKIGQAMDQLQKIGFQLWPPTLDTLGTLATISWLCREFHESHPDIRIRTDIGIKEDEIPDFLKSETYKILRDILDSIVQPGKTELVEIFFMKNESAIQMAIQFSGQGFNVEREMSIDSRLGMGLNAIRQRTELTGGSFIAESAVRGKFVMQISWPIEELGR